MQAGRLYFFVIFASLFLSTLAAYNETVINPDGICYLLGAQSFTHGSLQQTIHLCGQAQWPFYSFLIYGLTHLSPLSYQTSAFVWNSLFSLLALIAFIKIVEKLGGTPRILWFAALAFLLAHEFNSLRQSIIRDHGYWAAYLWSIWAMLHYMEKPSWQRVSLWLGCMLIAILFRVEGIIFLALMPFVINFRKSLYGCIILLTIGAFLYLNGHLNIENLGRLKEFNSHLQNGFSVILNRHYALTNALTHSAFTQASKNDVIIVAIASQIFCYLCILISALSWVYFLVIAYSFRSLPHKKSIVLLSYIAINVFITLTFFLENGFLSKRYIEALALTLMLWMPFALDYLWRQQKKIFYFAIVAMCVVGIGGIHSFGYSKSYLYDAGNWMASNIPQEATIFTNDATVMYYSNHFGFDLFNTFNQYQNLSTIENGQWKKYNYLALRLSNQENSWTKIAETVTLKPIKIFRNKRNDRVAIYKVENSA